MTARWGLYHKRHGFMAVTTVWMFLSDPLYVRNVEGVALFNTRTTARTVKRKMAEADVPVDGYVPRMAEVRVEVAGNGKDQRRESAESSGSQDKK